MHIGHLLKNGTHGGGPVVLAHRFNALRKSL